MSYFHPIALSVLQTFLETLFFSNLKGARLIYDSENLARMQKDIKLPICNLICSLKKLKEHVSFFFLIIKWFLLLKKSPFKKLLYDEGQQKTEQLYY